MMKITALTAFKFAATFVVGAGTKEIVTGIIKNNIAAPETTFQKVKIVAATTVLSGIVARQAKTYTDQTIDDIAEYVKKQVKAMQDGENILDEMLHKDAATVVDSDPVDEPVEVK